MAPITTIFNLTNQLPPSPQTLALATGFFDLFHSEHRHFLAKAKSVADFLLVGVEADLRARQLKGFHRPYQPQFQRAFQLSQLRVVDLVVLLPLNFSQAHIRDLFLGLVKPQILAVSSHSPNQPAKRSLVEKYGGRLLIVHQHNPQISTTILTQTLYNHSN